MCRSFSMNVRLPRGSLILGNSIIRHWLSCIGSARLSGRIGGTSQGGVHVPNLLFRQSGQGYQAATNSRPIGRLQNEMDHANGRAADGALALFGAHLAKPELAIKRKNVAIGRYRLDPQTVQF